MQALEIKLASASPLSILLAGNNLARLLGGLAVTVRISLIAVALSLPLGVLFGLLMTRERACLRAEPERRVQRCFGVHALGDRGDGRFGARRT